MADAAPGEKPAPSVPVTAVTPAIPVTPVTPSASLPTPAAADRATSEPASPIAANVPPRKSPPLAASLSGDAGPPKAAMKVLIFIAMMDLFGFGIIIPLLPFYVPGYAENTVGQNLKVTLLFSVYSICQFIGAPILGLMSDRYGRRPVLAISQAGSALGLPAAGAGNAAVTPARRRRCWRSSTCRG